MFKMILKQCVWKAFILFWRTASITYFSVAKRRTLITDALNNLIFSLISALEIQIFFIFQNAVHAFARRCLKSFIASFTQAPRYWKSSTISSTVSSSLISGFCLMFFDSTFVLSIFITNPTHFEADQCHLHTQGHQLSFPVFCWIGVCVW